MNFTYTPTDPTNGQIVCSIKNCVQDEVLDACKTHLLCSKVNTYALVGMFALGGIVTVIAILWHNHRVREKK